MKPPLLVFTTDFGLSDPYAGVMKGVALSINPTVRMVDLTHQIAPQDVAQAAFVLGTSYRYFPPDTIHVVVVDPGVGGDRQPVAVATPHGRFVGPDNGVLTTVLSDYAEYAPEAPGRAPLPPQVSATHLTNTEYWRHPVSNTFHGRDIFTPVAAHLSLGVSLEEMGNPIGELVWLETARPEFEAGAVRGRVVYQDRFGNLITNIPGQSLAGLSGLRVEVKGNIIHGLSRTFGDGNRNPIALIGSHGYLEVALPNGSAASFLDTVPGEPVAVIFY